MTPLDVGLEAMDKLYFDTASVPNKPTIRARCRAMLRAYDRVWDKDNARYLVNGVEKTLLAPLQNLLTGKDSTYLLAGKLDVDLEEIDGRKRHVLMDHKALGYLFDDDDIEQLLIKAQQLTYAYLGFTNKIRFDAAVWDILVKSKHSPSKETTKFIPGKVYQKRVGDKPKGTVIPDQTIAVPAEDLGVFEQRVFETYCNDYKKYFARPEVPIIYSNVAAHIQEQYLWVKELHMDSQGDRHLRNDEACKQYGRSCEYLGLCSGRTHEQDGTWKYDSNVHRELELPAEANPFKIVTNSRLQCFKACRLKHHRRYNLGLTKIKEDHNEALFVGTAIHFGLEHFWRARG